MKSVNQQTPGLLIVLLLCCSFFTTAQSLKFNGTNQYGRAPHNAALQLRSFTIEMWIRPEGTGAVSANGSGSGGLTGVYPLLSKGRGESESDFVDVNYYAGINSTTNKVGFDFEDDNDASNHPIYSATALTSCIWQHVAATYNDTTGVWKVYINGVEDSTKTLSTNFHPQSLSTVNLAFGSAVNSSNATDGFFNGSMDELRIWKRVRTAAEISAGKNLEITTHADLVARYGMTDGTGTTVSNSSSVGAPINAALFNTPAWNSNSFDALPGAVTGGIDFDGTNDHIAFGSASSLRATTFTLEGWIRIEGNGAFTSTGTGGITEAVPLITKGRGEAESPAELNMNYFFGLNASNVLVADFEESTGPNHPCVATTALKQNTWYHVAVTYGSNGAGGNDWKIYINGVLDKQQTEALSAVPVATSNQHSALATAMTSSGATQGFFNGKMDEVRIWNVVRTQQQILDNYLLQLTLGTGLIGRWGFNECSGTAVPSSVGTANGTITNGAVRTVSNFNPPPFDPSSPVPVDDAVQYADNKVGITVSDRNNQAMTVRLFGRKKPGGASSKFVIIGLPDTQYYTSHLNGGTNELFKAQTQWIADHRVDSNIVYVSQLGDCVENGNNGGNDIEWKRADTAMKKIENPAVPIPHGIPYSICVGNHDQGTIYNPNSPTTFYNQYFGEARFAGRPYYGGHYGDNNDNSFTLFSGGGIDFIHIALEYNDNNNGNGQGSATDVETLQLVLNWADSLLKAHPTRKGILSTHQLIGTGNPGNWQGGGLKIYDDLKDNPNLFLMLCGHVAGQGRRADVFNGNTVHTLLSDYQSGYTNGGNGYLRIMQFDPGANTLTVKTFSPTAGALPNATEIANGNFTLSVPLGSQFAQITSLNNVTGSVELAWPGLEPNAEYEWYVTVSDGESEVTSATYSFTTAGIVPVSLLKFQGVPEKEKVKLSWSTAHETGIDRYEIERSADGRQFSKIGTVAAANSNSFDYSSYDNLPLRGINYYRLRMIDKDGSFTHSRVVSVSMKEVSNGFEVYPNPATRKEINIAFASPRTSQANIRIYDLYGRLMMNVERQLNGGNIILKHSLPAGGYLVTVTIDGRVEARKIVVN
jgi:hypothetical protein